MSVGDDKMTYELLSKCFYKLPRQQYEAECLARSNSVSAVHMPININAKHSFYVCTNEMMLLQESIYRNNLILTEKIGMLPDVAKAFCIKKCLIDEVNTTNDIEGIYSTRKEIDEIYENIQPEAEKNKFKGLVDKYKLLIDPDTVIPLDTCGDIRSLYDDIILAEISQRDMPDGKIFRKGRVAVSDGIKEIHTGISGEDNIIDCMNSIISVMHDKHIPVISRAALCHYYIGYVHPFYNGNGRLSRFISSYILRQELNPLLSYRLAYMIQQNKQKYYKAFDICNDGRNQGDVTHFVLMFYELIEKSLDNLQSMIDYSLDRITYYFNQTDNIFDENEKTEKNVFKILIQNSLFENIGLSVQSLAYYSETSISTVRNTLKKIRDKMNTNQNVLETNKQSHTNVYSINIEAFDKCIG